MRGTSLGPTLLAGPLHLPGMLLIAAAARLLVSLLHVAEVLMIPISRLATEDNLRARRLYTEVLILRRVATLVIALLAAAAVLLTFPEVRGGRCGSPGLGRAHRGPGRGDRAATATNHGAGVQIAISQPIRVDDVVLLEGRWGRVEEISLTMVVGRAAPMPFRARRFRSRRRAVPVALSAEA